MWSAGYPANADGWACDDARYLKSWPVPQQQAAGLPLDRPPMCSPAGYYWDRDSPQYGPRSSHYSTYPLHHAGSFFPRSLTPPPPPPVHTTTIHTRAASGAYFHPYQPKPRPLLFVNTIPPPASSSTSGPLDSENLPQSKPKRKKINPEQLEALTALFEQTDSPSFDVREKLGDQLGMTNREVQVWFQNRRAKMNRMRGQESTATETKATLDPRSPQPPLPSARTWTTSATKPYEDSTWRHRSVSTSVVEAPARPEPVAASFNLPPTPQTQAPLPAQPTQIRQPSQYDDLPHQRPPQSGRSRPRPPGLQQIDIPDRRIFVSHHGRSPPHPASVLPSPFGMQSPSLGTPSTASPSFSSSGSSYFSATDVTSPYSPYTPSSFSSPSGTFLRLSLESPRLSSPRSDQGGFSNEGTPSDSALIRLPPIMPSSKWKPGVEGGHGRGHRRSTSDSGPPDRKLPSLKALVDSVSPRPSGSSEASSGMRSATSSPVEPRRMLEATPTRSPSGRLATLPAASERSDAHVPPSHQPGPSRSSITHVLSTSEQESSQKMAFDALPTETVPTGLGMLAIAASELDESDLQRTTLYAETRRMSYCA